MDIMAYVANLEKYQVDTADAMIICWQAKMNSATHTSPMTHTHQRERTHVGSIYSSVRRGVAAKTPPEADTDCHKHNKIRLWSKDIMKAVGPLHTSRLEINEVQWDCSHRVSTAEIYSLHALPNGSIQNILEYNRKL